MVSVVAQRDDRIDRGRAARGDQTGNNAIATSRSDTDT